MKLLIFGVEVMIACENIRLSSLFAAGDVSRGGTSAKVMNSKAQVKGKLGHVVQIHVCVCGKSDSKSL